MPWPTEDTTEIILDEAVELAEDLIRSGNDEEKVVAAVAEFLDAIIPFDAILPEPWGTIAEEADGKLLHKGVTGLFFGLKKLLSADPEKREERRQRRAERREERKARRSVEK